MKTLAQSLIKSLGLPIGNKRLNDWADWVIRNERVIVTRYEINRARNYN